MRVYSVCFFLLIQEGGGVVRGKAPWAHAGKKKRATLPAAAPCDPHVSAQHHRQHQQHAAHHDPCILRCTTSLSGGGRGEDDSSSGSGTGRRRRGATLYFHGNDFGWRNKVGDVARDRGAQTLEHGIERLRQPAHIACKDVRPARRGSEHLARHHRAPWRHKGRGVCRCVEDLGADRQLQLRLLRREKVSCSAVKSIALRIWHRPRHTHR
jgi:hypothetical protein